MCAPSTSASLIMITRWYLAASRSNEAPEPAPMTWMIAAHSVFLSMSARDAFCTLRILPRIGSSAWNSESLASLAVPSAESPSTMNSSLRSSAERQSTSLAGSVEAARADLRRWLSRCSRAAIRVFAAAATFSSTARACCLVLPAPGEVRPQLLADHLGDDAGGGGRAEHLLGLALELGLRQPDRDDGGEALERRRPW